MRNIRMVILFAACFASVVIGQAELPDIGIQSNLALGVVKNVGKQKIAMETKDGAIDVVLQSVTVFKRLPPDNLKLSAASDATLEEIAAGDRLLVTGKVSEDKTTIYSNKVFIVKGTELEEQAENRRRDWQARGIAGKVTEVNLPANSVTVKVSSLVGAGTELVVNPKEEAKFLRYSKISAKYADASESEISAISVGDTIQALGDRAEDGTSFAAEEILSGAFITVAGEVKSIDPEKGEITVSEFGSGNEIAILVNRNSLLKKFPEEIAQRMAMFISMRGSGASGRPANSGGERAQRGEGRRQGTGPGGGGMRRGGMDINQIAARFPAISLSELNAGDQIAVSSPKPDDPSRIIAIKLFAGVGPFLAAQSSSGRRRGGVRGSLSIPGLDSVDF